MLGIPQSAAVAARDARPLGRKTCGTSDIIEPWTPGQQDAASLIVASRFVGAKGGCGVWQTIISQMPPHTLYVEAFAGRATVLLRKRPAASSIVIEADRATCFALSRSIQEAGLDHITVICDDAVKWLEENRGEFNQGTLIYVDPPYLYETRSSGARRYYSREQGQAWSHAPLLEVLSRLAAAEINVLLNGYRSDLYDKALTAWRRIDYRTVTRAGVAVESLWCSFDLPARLHDYRFLGSNFRERERLKRKKARWLSKLRKMTTLEAAAILTALDEWRRNA